MYPSPIRSTFAPSETPHIWSTFAVAQLSRFHPACLCSLTTPNNQICAAGNMLRREDLDGDAKTQGTLNAALRRRSATRPVSEATFCLGPSQATDDNNFPLADYTDTNSRCISEEIKLRLCPHTKSRSELALAPQASGSNWPSLGCCFLRAHQSRNAKLSQ